MEIKKSTRPTGPAEQPDDWMYRPILNGAFSSKEKDRDGNARRQDVISDDGFDSA